MELGLRGDCVAKWLSRIVVYVYGTILHLHFCAYTRANTETDIFTAIFTYFCCTSAHPGYTINSQNNDQSCAAPRTPNTASTSPSARAMTSSNRRSFFCPLQRVWLQLPDSLSMHVASLCTQGLYLRFLRIFTRKSLNFTSKDINTCCFYAINNRPVVIHSCVSWLEH